MSKHKTNTHTQETPKHPGGRTILTGLTPRTQTGLERIAFFSDAVIAIAITLLALEIRLPDQTIISSDLSGELLKLTPRYISFLTSFFVIGMSWIGHHRIFEYLDTYDSGLIWINLVFLFLIAFIPFPTAVLGRFPAQTPSVVLYAVFMVAISLVRIWLWWYVYYKAKLVSPETDSRAGRSEFTRTLWTMIVFGISIAVAFWNPGRAMAIWFLLIPITILIHSKEGQG